MIIHLLVSFGEDSSTKGYFIQPLSRLHISKGFFLSISSLTKYELTLYENILDQIE